MKARVLVRAPSNIALIKYMGKKEGEREKGLNIPENPSLSMTLSDLCTYVEISPSSTHDQILNSVPEGALGQAPDLSQAGLEKFLKHLYRFRDQAAELSEQSGIVFEGIDEKVSISSSNTFPHSAGVASSASSFSALTLACFYYFAKDRSSFKSRFALDIQLRQVMAKFSRLGSGSSCRSFFGPFCSWKGEQVAAVPSALPELADLVLMISQAPKSVGSSEAHSRVKTSQEWRGRMGHQTRPERASARFHQLGRALSH